MKSAFSQKVWFVKTSTRIVKYKWQDVKSNPVFFIVLEHRHSFIRASKTASQLCSFYCEFHKFFCSRLKIKLLRLTIFFILVEFTSLTFSKFNWKPCFCTDLHKLFIGITTSVTYKSIKVIVSFSSWPLIPLTSQSPCVLKIASHADMIVIYLWW